MNKKQIAALAMCIATAATAVVGGTLAYFTDNDKVNNEFTIGNIDIDLWEYTDEGKQKQNQEGFTYENLMPTDTMVKEPHIENTGDNTAYVRVAVVMNNLTPIQESIDEVYEAAGKTEDDIQAIYDNVFSGFGISHLKTDAEKRRMWMDEADHAAGEGIELYGIDMAGKLSLNPEDKDNAGFYTHFSTSNLFQTETELARAFDGCLDDNSMDGYYSNAIESEERIYVFYLKMDADTDYTLFDGLNVPSDFTGEQMAMFDGLTIDIYADAIQTTGFDSYTAAFEALEAEHALGWWN